MTFFLLQMGFGGVGLEPLAEVHHAQSFSAPSAAHAIMHAEAAIFQNPAHYTDARAVVVTYAGDEVIWARWAAFPLAHPQ
jgi:hypothetical protein